MPSKEAHRRIGLGFLERLPLASDRRWIAYGFALASSLLALFVRWGIDAYLPAGFPFLTFFPAVILTAFLFGIGPGILAGVLSGLAALYWFVPPAGFAIAYPTAVAMAFYVLIITVDIALVHWMQRATAHLALERRRVATLAETRQTLFQELQHRVGNNLQMVASLISLQRRAVAEPAAQAALTQAARRVALVGRIQRTLYGPGGEQLPLAPYLEAIVRDTVDASARDDIALRFENTTGSAKMDPTSAIPAALIVTEAVSNAIEHGFAEAGGTLHVRLREDGGFFTVTVEDDGVGLGPGFDIDRSDSLGLRIARTLASSQHGEFTLNPREDGPGARATIRFAAPS